MADPQINSKLTSIYIGESGLRKNKEANIKHKIQQTMRGNTFTIRLKSLLLFIALLLSTANLIAQESNCSDGIDNDADGFVDCADSDCDLLTNCPIPTTCAGIEGDIHFSNFGENTNPSYTTQYLLADTNNVIQQVTSDTFFTNLSAGIYVAYSLNYETIGGISGNVVNDTIKNINGACFLVEGGVVFKVCKKPVANDDIVSTNEDFPISINILLNDVEGDLPLIGDSIKILIPPTNGTATFPNPSDSIIVYTPDLNYNGLDSIQYEICDANNSSLCDTAWVIITIDPVNDKPIAVDDVTSTPENTAVPIMVTLNDSDPNDPLGNIDPTSVDTLPGLSPVNGTVTINPTTGVFTYTPNPGYSGLDSLEYVVCDDGNPLPAQCDTAKVVINVGAVNDKPIAVDDAATTPEDTPIYVDVQDNDTDPDGAPLTTTEIILMVTDGTASISNGDSILYTPNPNFNGMDTLTYSVCDAGGLCDTAQVIITIDPVNDKPIAVDDAISTPENTAVPIMVTLNDSDPNDPLGNIDPTSVDTLPGLSPVNGTVTINPTTGVITYTPNPGYSGLDSLEYVVCDDGNPLPAQCDTAKVVINVGAVNDKPIAVDDAATTPEDTPIYVDVQDNDTDPDGDPLTTTEIILMVTDGTASISNGDSILYTPNPNFNGMDTLTYSVCDAGGLCDTAQVIITIDPVNDKPIAVDDAISTPENTAVPIMVTLNDSDPNDPLGNIDPTSVDTIPGLSPVNGTVTINPTTGVFTYTPNPGYSGLDSLEYVVCDDGNPLPAQCDTAKVVINVTSLTDPQIIINELSICDQQIELYNSGSIPVDVSNWYLCKFPMYDAINGLGNVTIVSGSTTIPIGGYLVIKWAHLDQVSGEIGLYSNNSGFSNPANIEDYVQYNSANNQRASVAVTAGVWDNINSYIAVGACDTIGIITSPNSGIDTDTDDWCVIADSFNGANGTCIDTDGDGVTDTDELIGVDNDPSTTNDNTDPNNPCDYNSNDVTLAQTTSYLTADCDGDGVTNEDEINGIDGNPLLNADNTDPNDPCDYNPVQITLIATSIGDCDGDGVTNADEINGPDGDPLLTDDNTDPKNPCEFNATQVTLVATSTGDCDGDGVTNADEINGPDGLVGGGDDTDPVNPCEFNASQITLIATSTDDCDGDGVTNADEINGPDGDPTTPDGTNPNDPCDLIPTQVTIVATNIGDCDGDGVTNADEINGPDGNPLLTADNTEHTNPCDYNATQITLVATSTGDCDGDGVTNADEINGTDNDPLVLGDNTNPNDPCDYNATQITLVATNTGDCDGDGVTNADEINGPDGDPLGIGDNTNPNNPCDYNATQLTIVATSPDDCDGDGVTNADEINGPDGDPTTPDGTNPNDPCDYTALQVTITATSLGDCDGDGVTNADEINGPDGDPITPDDTDPNDPCEYNATQITLVATSTGDCDGDGVTNADEINGPDGDPLILGDNTNPNDPCEFNATQVALVATSTGDCDGDGVTNADEINGPDGLVGGGDDTDPVNPCDYNATQITLVATSTGDCDGDGVTNADEINGLDDNPLTTTDNTNPNDPCDYNASDITLIPSVAWTIADCDDDGNPNGNDPNPLVPTATDDFMNAIPGVPATMNILVNDDYLPNNDTDNLGVTAIADLTTGSAGGIITLDPLTGTITYNALPTEAGTTVTVDYQVCNTTPNPDICSVATVHIIVSIDPDTDGDGVTDANELNGPDGNPSTPDGTDPSNPCEYNANQITLVATSTGDCDGDGVTNADEINGPDGNPLAITDNTDPNNPCEYNASQVTLVATSVGDCDGDGVTNADEINGPDGNPLLTADNTNPFDPCNYNASQVTLVATSVGDCDGDGVTNADEINGPDGDPSTPDGTDPNNPCEYNASQITLVATSTGDCDGDGVTNADEINGPDGNPLISADNTNPNDACDYDPTQITLVATSTGDCDGDGVTNADEINGPDGNPLLTIDNTNPFDPCDYNPTQITLVATSISDCDGDGVTNADEINGPDGNPNTPDGTNPNDACSVHTSQVTIIATSTGDCDGDGVTNADEINGLDDNPSTIADNTNPNDPCDFNTADISLPVTTTVNCNTCVTISTGIWLEGAFENGSMYTKLNDLGYLPGQNPSTFFGKLNPTGPGQPYNQAPWNYAGTEGASMDYNLVANAGYPSTVVDWVLVSLRTGTASNTTVCQRAGLLHSDGSITFEAGSDCCNINISQSYYVVIEHRNHLIVMSDKAIPVTGGNISYDFRSNQSYINLFGFGQKQVGVGVYLMYAGNGEQVISLSADTDINVNDKDVWLHDNGDHSSYYLRDFDLNGDVNVQDKNLWLENNGRFSDVPRN